MAGGDKQRVAARLAAPHPAKLFAFILQRSQRTGGGVQRSEFTAQALLRHTDGRHIDQQPKVAGDAQAARMRNAMTVDKNQVRLLLQPFPRGKQRGVLAE
ncbi:hypothetical protein D3C80_1950230 [compost metagenome]